MLSLLTQTLSCLRLQTKGIRVEENIKRPFNGKVLVLGNQYYFLNREETIQALKSYDLDIAEKYLKVDKDPKQQEGQFIDF